MASASGPDVVVTRTTHSSSPYTERNGNFWSGAQNQSCLYFMTVGGFYGVIVLAIYVCLRRGNIIFACLLFSFVFLPAGLKISWDKFRRWQARKQSLHRNAEVVERLNRHGTEDRGDRDAGSSRSVDESRIGTASYSIPRRSPPPKYGDIHPTDLPPSYAEAVELYGVPGNTETVPNTQFDDQHADTDTLRVHPMPSSAEAIPDVQVAGQLPRAEAGDHCVVSGHPETVPDLPAADQSGSLTVSEPLTRAASQ